MLVLPTSSASPGLEQPGDGGVHLPSLPQLRIRCCGTFSWDKPTRSGAGNVGKGCTQGPSFGLETSIMAHHSSSTIAGLGAVQLLLHAAGLAYSIFPQNRGLGASHSWTNPKGNTQHSLTSQGMGSRGAPRGAIGIMEAALLHTEMHFGPL